MRVFLNQTNLFFYDNCPFIASQTGVAKKLIPGNISIQSFSSQANYPSHYDLVCDHLESIYSFRTPAVYCLLFWPSEGVVEGGCA